GKQRHPIHAGQHLINQKARSTEL
ncbi:MAG: hypothetical protein FD162_3671, partial [Rhodobacteraceae bacterium]